MKSPRANIGSSNLRNNLTDAKKKLEEAEKKYSDQHRLLNKLRADKRSTATVYENQIRNLKNQVEKKDDEIKQLSKVHEETERTKRRLNNLKSVTQRQKQAEEQLNVQLNEEKDKVKKLLVEKITLLKRMNDKGVRTES